MLFKKLKERQTMLMKLEMIKSMKNRRTPISPYNKCSPFILYSNKNPLVEQVED